MTLSLTKLARAGALAAAIAAPTLVLATTAAAPAQAATAKLERINPELAQRHSAGQVRNFTLRRCLAPLWKVYRSRMWQLRRSGYRSVRFAGHVRTARCRQRISLIACRGHLKFRFNYYYRYGRLLRTSRQIIGRCLRR